MCGLVGVAGDLKAADVNAFNNMLLFDYVRGKHSTGVASVSSYNGEVMILKDSTDPINLMEGYKAYNTVVTAAKKILIGHNRHATRGKINRANAHPFHHGTIVGAHNGTLDLSCLKSLETDGVVGETDSEQLYATIAKRGIMETIPTVSGAWALTWFDSSDNSVNLLRNRERPLYYVVSESGKTLYWASEAWMLRVALGRENIKFGDVVEVEVDHVHSWQIPKSTEIFCTEGPSKTKLEGKEPENFQWGSAYGGPYQGNNAGNSEKRDYWNLPTREAKLRDRLMQARRNKDQDEIESIGWEVYANGWSDTADGPAFGVTNPWPTQLITFQDMRAKWAEGAQAQKDASAKKTNSVVHLSDRTKGTRVGPKGKKITAAQFREMTDHECGWCNDPVAFNDQGFFGTCLGDTIYVCQNCAKDKSQLVGIEEDA